MTDPTRWDVSEYDFGCQKILVVVDEGEPMEQYHVGAPGVLEFDGSTVKTIVESINGRQVVCRVVGDGAEENGE